MKQFLKIFKFIIPYKTAIACMALFSILFATANIFFLPLSRDIFEELTHGNLIYFDNQILNALLLYALRVASDYAQLYTVAWVSERLIIDIQSKVFNHILALSPHQLIPYKLGDLNTRLFSDTGKVFEALKSSLSDLIPQSLTFIGVITYLFLMDATLTAFTLLAAPIFIWVTSKVSGKLKQSAAQTQRKAGDITHIAHETLTNIKIVQINNMEQKEIERFKHNNSRSIQSAIKALQIKTKTEPFITLSQFLVITLVIALGGRHVVAGTLTGPELVSFFMGIFLLTDPILAISKSYNNIQQASVSIDRVFEILNIAPKIQIPKAPKTPQQITGEIRFENVSFAYSRRKEVLKNITLSIAPGERIGIVGHSGAGKTSLIQLILRFFDPKNGTIKIDDIDLKEWHPEKLRNIISLVAQEDILFRGSIKDNIRYGSKTKNTSAIKEAAIKAHAWEFIEKLPGKLHAIVGDRGLKLSGGQRQRISIARAILRDPKILILDEATSALDSESENAVQAGLENLLQNRTSITIAHRLSTIENADRIIVLDQGLITQMGTHQELIQQEGIYAQLHAIQFKETTPS